jgi:7-cyano-7-deazaguanine reductase
VDRYNINRYAVRNRAAEHGKNSWTGSHLVETSSTGTGYTDEHAHAGIDAELPAIDVWPNQFRGYEITIAIPEYTSICPKTGLPDYGTITIRYMPAEQCLELKALKYYILAYRNLGIFYENAVNRILRDIVAACQPVRAVVTGEFNVRGGMRTIIEAKYPLPSF